jgi:hypothetical protein
MNLKKFIYQKLIVARLSFIEFGRDLPLPKIEIEQFPALGERWILRAAS